jgi:hypothetical protein
VRISPGLLRIAAAITLCAGFLLVLWTLPSPPDADAPAAIDGVTTAASQLRGEGYRADFAQDYTAARALVTGGDVYEPLTVAFARIGLEWDVQAATTHPPTAGLVALPVAWLPWPLALTVWAWAMLGAIVAAAWAVADDLPAALVAGPVLLFWPPLGWSIGQLTVLLLLGQCLAWRWRDRPALAGSMIALATLPKWWTGILLVPFLLHRDWGVLRGFVAVIGAALLAVLVLNPQTFSGYLHEGREATQNTVSRTDNGALLPWLLHNYGHLGIAAGICLVLAVIASRWRSWHVWVWVSVATLPIAWIYSLAPLAQGLVRYARVRPVAALFAVGVAMTASAQPYGDVAARYQAIAVMLIGGGLLLTRWSTDVDGQRRRHATTGAYALESDVVTASQPKSPPPKSPPPKSPPPQSPPPKSEPPPSYPPPSP